MPCMDHGHWDRDDGAQDRLDNVTRMLCELCATLETNGKSNFFSGVRGLRTWWKQHKKLDRERREREEKEQQFKKLQQQALKKLTDEERKALGL